MDSSQSLRILKISNADCGTDMHVSDCVHTWLGMPKDPVLDLVNSYNGLHQGRNSVLKIEYFLKKYGQVQLSLRLQSGLRLLLISAALAFSQAHRND